MLIEVGGVDNTLDELYNTIDVLTEAFSKYYWNDAEKRMDEGRETVPFYFGILKCDIMEFYEC